MNFIKLVLNRPMSVVMIIIMLVWFGLSSISNMKAELMPEMNCPMLVVMTVYDGAGPEDVDDLVTTPIEDSLSTLSGVQSSASTSSEGSSVITLSYDYDTDMDGAYDDVSKKLTQLESQLPEACETPVIMEMDANASSPMTLSVSGNPQGGLYNYIENTMKPKLEALGAVASVTVSGGEKEYISVSLNRDAVSQYGLSVSDIAAAVSQADFSAALGSTQAGDVKMNVSAEQSVDSMDELSSVAISLPKGGVVTLGDVADIFLATKDADTISCYDGEDALNITFAKEQSSTSGMLSMQVKEVIEDTEAEEPDVKITIVDDESKSIASSINSVSQTLYMAIILSMIVLFLFLGDIRASLIVASAMPVSLFVAAILMKFMGFTLNMITLCALVIGVGMMVDNSIVVLESCFRARKKGLSLFEAAVVGTQQETMSVAAGTLTTVVVFFPLAFISGMVGQLFKPLGFVIIFSMCASLISSLTIVPLAYYKYKPVEKEKAPLTRFMAWLSVKHRQAMTYLLHRTKTVFGVVLLLLVVSVIAVMQVGSELMASTDDGSISITMNTRAGLTLEKREQMAEQIEDIISQDKDVEHYTMSIGSSGGTSGTSSATSFMAYLKDDRSRSTADVVSEWKKETEDMMNCDIDISGGSSSSSSSDDTVSVSLSGEDYEAVKEGCSQIVQEMQKRADVARVSSSFADGAPVVDISFDPQLCASYGFNSASVASEVYGIMNGQTARQLTEDGQEYDVIVEYNDMTYDRVDDVAKIQVTSATGNTVDLSDIADIHMKDSTESISKTDGAYNATIDIQLRQEYVDSSYTKVSEAANNFDLPYGVSYAASTTSQQMAEEFSSLFKAILLAIFLVFAVMTMQFESIRFSVMVMTCIPFCFVGSFLLMYFTKTSISMVSLLGFVMLIGTVVNAGILYVDTANEMRKELPLDEALIEAGVTRLRPILMTTLTTIISMIPLAMGMGENAELLQGFAIVAIGGLTASTLMALLMLPTFYLVMMRKDKGKKKRSLLNRILYKKDKSVTESEE